MDIDEVDVAIEELDTRLERLRALYEQYFLGIEKIEPAIARKDVDRRIWLLRREQIRNTAKRFRLQTIIQRYNTFQQYWSRICREIENGTYKRHVLRAEKSVGSSELLTIAARKRLGAFRRKDAEDEDASEQAYEVERELGEALEDPGWNPLEQAKRAVDEVLGRDSLGPPRVAVPAPSSRLPASAPAPASARARAPSQDFERLDLEMDDLLGSSVAPAPPSEAKPRPAAAAAARAAAAAPRPGAPPARPVTATAAAAPRPAAAPAERPKVANPATTRPSQPPVIGTAAARPPARPPASPGPTVSPAKPAPDADPRVRDLHARLVAAKRETNDNREVTVEGLKKSLQAVEDRLRQQHGNRKIDFDVVIKDGKAVVKPILR